MTKEYGYIDVNPTWHTEDSPWKADHILNMIQRNKLAPKSVVEIGCGAGEILNQLQQKMQDKSILFSGYEIASDAFLMAKTRESDRLHFYNEDLTLKNEKFDLLLMIDVFEHVEDPFNFIRKASSKAAYKIYHIPLDISVYSVLINNFKTMRYPGGHINYYTKYVALETLKETGNEVIDFFYTSGYTERNQKGLTLFGRFMNMLRRVFFKISPDATAKILGGYSLLVLTK